MKKIISLLKAVLSQDMDLFKYKASKNSSRLGKLLFPLMIGIILMVAIGTYAFMIMEPLHKVGMTFVGIALFTIVVAVLTLMEGVYKAQGILFESRDNDLLLSLPIKRSTVLFVKIFKYLLFEIMYGVLFMIPVVGIYAYFEHPGINFYITSIIMILFLPIIPTVVSAFLGYLVKLISSKFKSSKIVQTFISFIFFFGALYLSLNLDKLIESLAKNATTVNDFITKIYYPAGVYINSINKINILEILLFVLISLISVYILVLIGGKFYFKIISKSKSLDSRGSNKILKYNKHGKNFALIKREIVRYFSSPVYIFNTMFGLLLCIIGTVVMCANPTKFVEMLSSFIGENTSDTKLLSLIYIQFVVLMSCMTNITCSSISLEGKSFNLTKTLPVSEFKLIMSKVLASVLICLPFLLVGDLLFIIFVGAKFLEIIYLIVLSLITPFMIGLMGVLVNLYYPKLDATNDTEVVKQSKSSLIAVYLGMILGALPYALVIYFNKYSTFIILGEIITFIIISLALIFKIKTTGVNKIKELSV